jgi:hypothetical protein
MHVYRLLILLVSAWNKLLRAVIASTALIIASNQAGAADATMPIMFVGDWCYDWLKDRTTNYTLPSWTEGGLCKNILSINPWGFYSKGWHCEPIKVREKKDCAPSGCGYDSVVVASCQPDGPVTSGARKQFQFSRYKGNLLVTEK